MQILGQDPLVVGLVMFAVIVMGWLIKKAMSGNFGRY